MSRRKRVSGGQAIVMVTLALFSMVGMMGLAVDLGWSYFAQKQAQAVADTGALAAAQEAVQRLGTSSNISGFSCNATTPGYGVGAGLVECTESPGGTKLEYCGSTVTSSSNLYSGCLYAKRNGFQYDVAGSNQIVSVQSGDVTDVNAPPGVKRISYWVRVRTIQTIPQLFSFIAGNQQGTVAANATAAIAGAISPGSFYGMNRKGDCLTGTRGDAGNCGLDILTGHGGGNGKGGSQTCGAASADLCAPAGIILASSCGVSGGTGCDQNYAGKDSSNAGAMASSLTIMGPSGAVVGTWNDMSGRPLTVNHSTNASLFQDFFAPHGQPPLETSASTMGSCAIPWQPSTGTPPTIQGSATLGPYLYYSYHTTSGGKPVPDGAQIRVTGTATFSQSNTVGCPPAANVPVVSGVGGVVSSAGTQSSPTFPTYVFVGGLNNSGGTLTLAGGQYVMAGTAGTNVFVQGGTLDGNTQTSASSTGTMFIFTDAAYPTLNLPASFSSLVTGNSISNGGTALNQGTIDFSNNISSEIYGAVNSTNGSGMPSTMNAYTGIAFWQDRRNSTVGYNEASGSPGCPLCTSDNGSVLYCLTNGDCPNPSTSSLTTLKNANHVTGDSPGVFWTNGNTKVAIHGAYYQPRGAWMDFSNGNTGIGCGTVGCPLQVITGAVIMGSGTTRLELAGPTNPVITYKAVLIQ